MWLRGASQVGHLGPHYSLTIQTDIIKNYIAVTARTNDRKRGGPEQDTANDELDSKSQTQMDPTTQHPPVMPSSS